MKSKIATNATTKTTHQGDNAMTTKGTTSKKSAKKPSTSATATASTTTAMASTQLPISSADVAQCQTLLNQLNDILGPVTQLTGDDIRRSLKLRKGGAQVVTDLVALCNHHGVSAVGPVTPESMSAQKARADTLHQIGVQFGAVGKKLSDATFSADSSTWRQATALYTVLQRLSLMDPTLAEGLEPVQAFFQTKRTKGKVRATNAAKALTSAQKLVAEHQGASSAAAAPAPAATSAGSSAGASSGSSPSAPAAAAVAPTNGIAHS